MTLATMSLQHLRARILAASERDYERLSELRSEARRLKDKVRPIRSYLGNAVSFVASDGGDNRVMFNPATVELVRVVDSRGNECAFDAVASGFSLADLENRARPGTEAVTPLANLCKNLGMSLSDISYMIRTIETPGKATGALRCYRDIVEWAVLYDMICNLSTQWAGDTIVVRDGLLRTKSFSIGSFPLLDKLIRAGITRHGERGICIYLVGVAKQNAVLSRLALALELEGVMRKDYPCFVEVPRDIEEKCYNYERSWLDTLETAEEDEQGRKLYQSMGQLYLAKFGDRPDDPVWPVDIFRPQVPQAANIIGLLTRDAQQGFPVPDYPMCIQRAHGYARIGGLEVDIIQDMLIDAITSRLSDREAERLLRLKYLGRNLQALRNKEA